MADQIYIPSSIFKVCCENPICFECTDCETYICHECLVKHHAGHCSNSVQTFIEKYIHPKDTPLQGACPYCGQTKVKGHISFGTGYTSK